MQYDSPGEIELLAAFSRHLGPRFEAAGLRIQFHYNQIPGIHFKVEPTLEYRASILQGLQDGMASRFPNFPRHGSVWVTEVIAHDVDSSARAFYKAARLVIEQAHALMAVSSAQLSAQADALCAPLS